MSRTYRDGTRTVTALEGTDMDIPDGKFVTIVGPSACGKSTLLNLFCGLDKPDTGSIETPALGNGRTPRTRGVHAPAGHAHAVADGH